MLGLIPQSFIDELLNRTDIVEFIDGYVPLKKRGTSHIACCPFHSEKTPSFNVVAKKQFYHCFGCGASGNVISFAMNYLHQGFSDAIETLAARTGMQVPRDGDLRKNKQSESLYHLLDRVATFYQKTLKKSGQVAIDYLKGREVSGEVARLFQIGYAPAAWQTLEPHFSESQQELIATGMLIQKDDGKRYDRYRQRIMFPIHDRHGRIIGFGGRAIEADQKPKYLNSPETVIFQKNRELYGLHQILQKQNKLDWVLVVEGYMDVIALAQHGVSNAVATLGTATSSYHIQLLSKHTKELIFCFDGDSAGRQAAWRGLEASLMYLNSGLGVRFIFLPEGHDPDSLIREEGKERFLERLQQAIPLNQFFFDTLARDLDHSSLAAKSQLVNSAKPYFIKMTDGPYKQLMIDELARLTRIEHHRLNQLIEENSVEKINETVTTIERTPIRVAIAILLQNPETYTASAQLVESVVLDDQKHVILKQLMQQIAQNTGINTAALVELWREQPLFDSLNKLAAWDHHVPEEALANEFIDIVFFLARQNEGKDIQQLIDKARKQGLTASERHTLQAMLTHRHKVIQK